MVAGELRFSGGKAKTTALARRAFGEYVGRVAYPKAVSSRTASNYQAGNTTVTKFAFNMRFDMYDGPFNGSKNDANYRPARNVRKGYMVNDKTTMAQECRLAIQMTDDGEADLDFSKA